MAQISVNTFHKSKWVCRFSNIPTIHITEELAAYDYNVKSITVPNFDLEEILSRYHGSVIRHPVTKPNDNLPPLDIEFKVDEEMMNYFYILEWICELKYGQNVSTTLIRDNSIKSIDLTLLDNQKREKRRLTFTNALIKSVSSLTLGMGNDDEVTFRASFTYEEMKFVTI